MNKVILGVRLFNINTACLIRLHCSENLKSQHKKGVATPPPSGHHFTIFGKKKNLLLKNKNSASLQIALVILISHYAKYLKPGGHTFVIVIVVMDISTLISSSLIENAKIF